MPTNVFFRFFLKQKQTGITVEKLVRFTVGIIFDGSGSFAAENSKRLHSLQKGRCCR